MTVARILAEKGRTVETVNPDMTIDTAIHRLAEKGIGALIVCGPDHALAGIISERDVMRALARDGGAAFDAPVSRYMTAKVVTCTRDAAIEDVMATMTEQRFRHIPVVDDGRLAGIVSIGDVVKHRIAAVEADYQAMRDYITLA